MQNNLFRDVVILCYNWHVLDEICFRKKKKKIQAVLCFISLRKRKITARNVQPKKNGSMLFASLPTNFSLNVQSLSDLRRTDVLSSGGLNHSKMIEYKFYNWIHPEMFNLILNLHYDGEKCCLEIYNAKTDLLTVCSLPKVISVSDCRKYQLLVHKQE